MIGITAHQPNQTLLQKAITNAGKAVFLVHTLQGLACFNQVSSSSLNMALIFLSKVV